MPTTGERGKTDTILRTKLYRPRLTPEMVVRERLYGMMDRGADMSLTLVSAPAGYGKSVLLSQWLEHTGVPAAWVSLDESDRDLRSFLTYLLAALDTVAPGACANVAEILATPALPPVAVLANLLVNDLDALDDPCVVVIDDYHRVTVESPVHDLMTRVLDHPPRPAHFVVATRRDPPLLLASMRAGSRINELRLQDLRFTGEETRAFLASVAGLAVGEEALRNLQFEVEGWAVGLRLLVLALRQVPDPDTFLRELEGGLPQTQAYLLQEVLGRLRPGFRGCLLASSVLDRFCAPLLDAICRLEPGAERGARTADGFLEDLRRENLFTIALDGRGEWFRYHHLFRDLLASELLRVRGEEFVAELHVRASAWFEDAELVEEALHHALAAGDVERAADLVERNRRAAVNADRWYVLEDWLSRLPAGLERRRPELMMARGWLLLHWFRWEEAFALLDQVELLLDDSPAHEALRGEVALFRGYMLMFMGRGAESLVFTDQALAKIPPSFYEARAQSAVIHSMSLAMVGRKQEADRFLGDLLATYDDPDELRKTRILVAVAFLHYLSGELAETSVAIRRLGEIADANSWAYAQVWVAYMEALVELHRFDLDAVVGCETEVVEKRFIMFTRSAVDALGAIALAHAFQGRSAEAARMRMVMREFVAGLNDPSYLVLADSWEVRLAVLLDERRTVLRSLETDGPPHGGAMIWFLDVPAVTRCRTLLYEGSVASLEAARAESRRCVDLNEGHHNLLHLVESLVLLASAHEASGRPERADAAVARALELARPGGVLLPFLEAIRWILPVLERNRERAADRLFIARILAVAAQAERGRTVAPPATARPAAAGPLGELTNRELDVLELLPERLQNKEIAERLCISHHTVKHHLKQIYEKLDVHDRRHAVVRAREIGILAP